MKPCRYKWCANHVEGEKYADDEYCSLICQAKDQIIELRNQVEKLTEERDRAIALLASSEHLPIDNVKEKDAEILALYYQLTKHEIEPPDIPKSVETLRDLVNSAYRILKFSAHDHFQDNPGYKWEMGRLLIYTSRYTTLLNKIPSKPITKCMDCNKEITGDDIIRTFSQTEAQLTLCHPCYLKRGNTVR